MNVVGRATNRNNASDRDREREGEEKNVIKFNGGCFHCYFYMKHVNFFFFYIDATHSLPTTKKMRCFTIASMATKLFYFCVVNTKQYDNIKKKKKNSKQNIKQKLIKEHLGKGI